MFQDLFDTFIEPIKDEVQTSLDFGCGKVPVLGNILKRVGLQSDVYDLYFHSEKIYEGKEYELITSTEVVEHLKDPKEYLRLFKSLLKRDGYLVLMTKFLPESEKEFLNWWYIRDETHISFFSFKTFEKIAQIFGLEIVDTNHKDVIVLKNRSDLKLEILYEDREIVAINKPAGLLVHRSNIDKNESLFAMHSLRDQIGEHVFPVHRLDKPTSGVLLFGKNSAMAKDLSEMFAEKTIEKTYLAVVRGYTPDSLYIDYPLKKIIDKFGVNRKKSNEAQEAVTDLKTLGKIELAFPVGKYSSSRYSLVKLTPKTGRKHQLRRHLKHISHPIIGDKKYGKAEHNNLFIEKFHSDRLLLHAYSLEFIHPRTEEKIQIVGDIDTIVKDLFKKFHWEI